jgi:hypothetical protein
LGWKRWAAPDVADDVEQVEALDDVEVPLGEVGQGGVPQRFLTVHQQQEGLSPGGVAARDLSPHPAEDVGHLGLGGVLAITA